MSDNPIPVVVPGSVLGNTEILVPGEGTYVIGPLIFASLPGVCAMVPSEDHPGKYVVNICRQKPPACIPQIDDIVLCRVVKITPRQAFVEILSVENASLTGSFKGIIFKRNVRETDIDSVEIVNSFRPGDIVRAKVLSLGDARSYYLTTASNDLGVIFGLGNDQQPLIPISWDTMQSPVTLVKEKRKVAKVQFTAFQDNENMLEESQQQETTA